MKRTLLVLAVALFPLLSSAGAKKPGQKPGSQAERILSSEDSALDKKSVKKCEYGEQQLSDGSCERINERQRPMRPDRN